MGVIVSLALVGCGGSDEPPTPEQVAEQLGCSGFQVTQTEELGVSEQGECTVDGDDVTINTFSNNEARDSWYDIARKFGGPYFVGDGFIAYSDGNRDTTEGLAEKLDGEIKR